MRVRATGIIGISMLFSLVLAVTGSSTASWAQELVPLRFERPAGPFQRSPTVLLDYPWPENTPDDQHAFKDGTTLRLRLDGDRQQLLFFDLPIGSWSNGPVHRYVGWLAAPRFHIVTASFFDWGTTYLVDARDGRVTETGGIPVLSPSGDKAIVWLADYMNGSVGPYLVDFRVHPPVRSRDLGTPNCEKRNRPAFLRQNPIWIDDSAVKFEGENVARDKDDAKQLLRIVDGKAEWQC